MLVRWRVPYFDRTDKKRKERILFLDIGTCQQRSEETLNVSCSGGPVTQIESL
jgi:hypothetical protein